MRAAVDPAACLRRSCQPIRSCLRKAAVKSAGSTRGKFCTVNVFIVCHCVCHSVCGGGGREGRGRGTGGGGGSLPDFPFFLACRAASSSGTETVHSLALPKAIAHKFSSLSLLPSPHGTALSTFLP